MVAYDVAALVQHVLSVILVAAVETVTTFSIIYQFIVDIKSTLPNTTAAEVKQLLVARLQALTDEQFAAYFPTLSVRRLDTLQEIEALPLTEEHPLYQAAVAKTREARINKNKIVMLLARRRNFFPTRPQVPDCKPGCYLDAPLAAPPPGVTAVAHVAAHRGTAQPCTGCLTFFEALPTQKGDALKEPLPANATPLDHYRVVCSLNPCAKKDLNCNCGDCVQTRRYGLLWPKVHPTLPMDNDVPKPPVPPVPQQFGPPRLVRVPVPPGVIEAPPAGLTLAAMREGVAWHAAMVRSLPAERCPLPACGHTRRSRGLDGPTQAQDPLWQVNWRLGMCTTCVRKLSGHVRLFASKEGVHAAYDPHRFVFETQLMLFRQPQELQLFNEMVGNAFGHLASLCVEDLDREGTCCAAPPPCTLPATLRAEAASAPVGRHYPRTSARSPDELGLQVGPSKAVLHDAYLGRLCAHMALSTIQKQPQRNAIYTSATVPQLYRLLEHHVQPLWRPQQVTQLQLLAPVWELAHPAWAPLEPALRPGELAPLSVLRVARVLYEALVPALNALLFQKRQAPLCGAQVVLFAPLTAGKVLVGLSLALQHGAADAERAEALRVALLLCQVDDFARQVLVARNLLADESGQLVVQRVPVPDHAAYFPPELVQTPAPPVMSLAERVVARPAATLVVRFANRVVGHPLNVPPPDDDEPPVTLADLQQRYEDNVARRAQWLARLEHTEQTSTLSALRRALTNMVLLDVPPSLTAHPERQTVHAAAVRAGAAASGVEPSAEKTEAVVAARGDGAAAVAPIWLTTVTAAAVGDASHDPWPKEPMRKATPAQNMIAQELARRSNVGYVVVVTNGHGHVHETLVVREGEQAMLTRPLAEPFVGVELLPLYDVQVAPRQLGYERTLVLTRPLHELTRQDWLAFVGAVGWSQSRYADGRDWRAHVAKFQGFIMAMPRNPFARIPLYKHFRAWWTDENLTALLTTCQEFEVDRTPVMPDTIVLASHIFTAVLAGYHVHQPDPRASPLTDDGPLALTLETNFLPSVAIASATAHSDDRSKADHKSPEA